MIASDAAAILVTCYIEKRMIHELYLTQLVTLHKLADRLVNSFLRYYSQSRASSGATRSAHTTHPLFDPGGRILGMYQLPWSTSRTKLL